MSNIGWTDKTWNPIAGCKRISPGCDNCYAILEARRKVSHPRMPHYHDVTAYTDGMKSNVPLIYAGPKCGLPRPDGSVLNWTNKIGVAGNRLFYAPLRIKAPTVFFVNSMSDLFHEGVSDEVLVEVFKIMNQCPQHTFQVLTKRPSRMVLKTRELSLKWTSNIWAGVSVEEDKYARPRVRELLKVPAKLRFVSAEPLLGALPSLEVESIDWLIVGGESGRGNSIRPMDRAWALDLRNRARLAGTPFFFKQWGAYGEDGVLRSKTDNGHLLAGEEIFEMPADAYDRLKSNGRVPDPSWTRIPKQAMRTPTNRFVASANLLVIDGIAETDEDEFVLQKMKGERDAYENPQRLKKLVSAADKERLDLEAQWAALGVDMQP
jgi:protein gp37